MAVSRPPINTSHLSPNRGYSGKAFIPKGVMWHITDGSGASALSWLTNPASDASANFLIMEDGSIYCLVPADQAAWAQGNCCSPASVIAQRNPGVNPNLLFWSIECAGKSSWGSGGSLTSAQIRSLVWLTAYLLDSRGIPASVDTIIGHNAVAANCSGNDNRAGCPGYSVDEWAAWRLAVQKTMTGSNRSPHINAAGETVINGINLGGRAVKVRTIQVTVQNEAGELYRAYIVDDTTVVDAPNQWQAIQEGQ